LANQESNEKDLMPETVAPELAESHLVEGEMPGRTLKEDSTPFSRNRRASPAGAGPEHII
jgi:hypothetical protein